MRHPYLTTGSEEIRFNCPRCGDTKYHLYYNPRRSLYHCFRCSYSGKGYPAELASLVLPPTPRQEEKKQRELEWQQLGTTESVMEMVIWDYLLNERKLTRDLVISYTIGWSPKIPFTIVFPISMNGRLKAFQVRYLTKTFAKYVFYPARSTEELKKKTLLYNYDKVKSGVETLYVVEGVFDVLCSEPNNSVCTFGKEVSVEQAKLIYGIPKQKLVLAYDTDVKLNELQRSVERLEVFEPVFVKKLPNGKDPADLGSTFKSQPEYDFLEFATNL